MPPDVVAPLPSPSFAWPKAQILEAICGPQGLSNADVTLRTRSCYFLTKLVKAMREGIVQYVDVIVPGVQGAAKLLPDGVIGYRSLGGLRIESNPGGQVVFIIARDA